MCNFHDAKQFIFTYYLSSPLYFVIANMQAQPLSTLTPMVTNVIITAKVDTIYNREFVWIIGLRRTPMKELISIDLIVFDQEVI